MKITGKFAAVMLLGSQVALAGDPDTSDLPIQSRQLQLVQVADAYRIGIDTDPEWSWEVGDGVSNPVFTATAPANYYPPASASVSYFTRYRLASKGAQVREMAIEAVQRSLDKFQVKDVFKPEKLTPFQFKEVTGYSYAFVASTAGELKDVAVYVGRSSAGSPVSLTFVTAPGKLPHLEHLISRFGNSFHPLR